MKSTTGRAPDRQRRWLVQLSLLLVTLLLGALNTACGASAGMAMSADYAPGYNRSEGMAGGMPTVEQSYEFDDVAVDGELAAPSSAEIDSRGPAKKTAGEAERKPEGDAAPDKSVTQTKRYIIYSAQMGVFVESVEGAHESVEALAKKHGGWLKTSENTRLQIRVPAENFEPLVEALKGLGDVQYVNKTGLDVTEEFFDLEARLANAEHMRKRYIELLAKAKNVEESLAIERELGRITEIIERHKGRLKYLKNHIAFSTIEITLQPKPNELGTPQRIPLPFGWLRGYKIDALVR